MKLARKIKYKDLDINEFSHIFQHTVESFKQKFYFNIMKNLMHRLS